MLKLIPTPKKITGDGVRMPITAAIHTEHDAFAAAAQSITDYAQRIHGIALSAAKGGIELVYNGNLAAGEYTLTVEHGAATLSASDNDGISYALATLLQLIEKNSDTVTLPAVSISDRPDCGYRALMVDLARKWHPFHHLYTFVDLCYIYKIKYLHLHFIDSQSYTLPSDAFPKMPTEGRHYTKEEIAELNAYALSKNIEIIPEMEVPGHAASMVSAYPELFADTLEGDDTVDSYSLFNNTQKQNIICVGKPGIMDTLRTLTKEIIAMFPNSRYLHIGGDEAKISDWAACRDCKKYMAEHGIAGPKPLYTHFVKKMTDMVLELGKTPIVWEGFPREGSEEISRDVIVTAWESYYHLAPELVEEGFKITNSSWQPLYIVPKGHKCVPAGSWSPEEILEWNVYNWQNWNPKTAAYKTPINIAPTEQVLGATLCAWECNFEEEIDAVKNNIAALSERTWNIRPACTAKEFMNNLEYTTSLVDKVIS